MTTNTTPADLTPREREIMDRLARGEDYKTIRKALGITYRTVQAHVSNVKKKAHLSGPVHRVVAWYMGS